MKHDIDYWEMHEAERELKRFRILAIGLIIFSFVWGLFIGLKVCGG